MARINIPSNKDKLIALSKAILAKHTDLGAASPLGGLKIADWTASTAKADTENKKAAQLRRDAEIATENCDLAIGDNRNPLTVEYNVRSARDILAGLNKGNERKLGEWGFEVDSAAQGGASASAATPTPPGP
jgi:hypothetical protein